MSKSYKISKLTIWPSRKVNLGNFETLTANAGVEVVFDEPVEIDSIEVKNALDDMRKLIREEFKKQAEPYLQRLKKSETDK